jgi:hypothetical protein
MPRYEFTIGDIFPADDPVARWLVTISAGLNDLLLANQHFRDSRAEHETLYFFRLASAHLWELAKFITETYDSWDEIRAFVDGLQPQAREALEAIRRVAKTGDLSTVGTELVQIRDLFSHYQRMNPQVRDRPRDPITRALQEVAENMGDVEVGVTFDDLRLGYADEVIGKTLMRLIPEEADQQRVLEGLAEGVGHTLRFVDHALHAWLGPRRAILREV